MGRQGSSGGQNTFNKIWYKNTFGMMGDKCDSRWTPAKEEPPQGCLFRIIRDVWPEAIDSTTKVPIRAPNNVWSCHEGSQWEENCCD